MFKGSIDQRIADAWRSFLATHGVNRANPENSLDLDKEFIETEEAVPLFRLRNLALTQSFWRAETRAAAKASPYQELLFGNDPNERLPVNAAGSKFVTRADARLTDLEASVAFREAKHEKKVARKIDRAMLPDPEIEADKRLIAAMKPYAGRRRNFTVQDYLDLAAASVEGVETGARVMTGKA